MKQELEDFLSKELGEPVEFAMTDTFIHGDLTTPVALALAKKTGRPPRDVAAEVAAKLASAFPAISIEIAGPGFVNITLPSLILAKQIARVHEPTLSQRFSNETIVIEYSQPNIAKPMHFGHLRTTILGESIKRLFAAAGARAIGVNHLGDWGSQFGKLVAAYKRWGSLEELKSGGIQEMLRLYVKFHEEAKKMPELVKEGTDEFVKLERGDKENRELWQLMRDVSLVEFRRFYERLDIRMDEPEMGESSYEPMLEPLIDDALARGIAVTSEGAIVIPVGDDMPPCIIRKSDGATIYATRDLAQIKYRVERWHPHRLLYVVAADQSLHFKQVFRAAEKLGLVGSTTELVHIPYGLVNLPSGKKMSTRAGQVIFLDDVLHEAVERAGALLKQKSPNLGAIELGQLAEEVGVGAVKYQVLNQNRNSTIVFDWDKMMSLQGNTGPYLQYTLARATSVLQKAETVGSLDLADDVPKAELELARQLARFPWVVEYAAASYAPNHLTDWLFGLASEFNAFYEQYPILQAEPAERSLRLGITQAVRDTLARGLDLLGIAAPERL